MRGRTVSRQTLGRLPVYLNRLRELPDPNGNISATMLAASLRLNDVQVRKDLAAISDGGRPKTGYRVCSLITDIEHFLGYDNTDEAVLVGVGNLGRALLSYKGFERCGVHIVAAFDTREDLAGTYIAGREVFPASELQRLCRRMKIRLGIIAVPSSSAQNVCEELLDGGVLAVWNFAPVRLEAPENVLVQNENMASSLAVLSQHLASRISEETEFGREGLLRE